MSRNKRVAAALSFAVLGEAVNKLSPFLILHIVATRLGVEQYGFAQFGIWLVDMATFSVVFGYTTLASIEIGKAPRQRSRILTEVICGRLIQAVITLIVFLFVVSQWYQDYWTLAIYCSLILFTTAFDCSYYLIGTQRVSILSILMALAKMICLGAMIALVTGPDDAVMFAFLTFATNGVVSLATFSIALKKDGVSRPQWSAIVKRFYRAVPYSLSLILLVCLERFDLFVVERHFDSADMGLYAAPARLMQSVLPMIVAVGFVFFAEMVSTKTKEELQSLIKQVTLLLFMASVPLAFGMSFVDETLLGFVFGEAYLEGSSVLAAIIFGILPHIFIFVLGMHLLPLLDKIRLANLSFFIAAIAGIAVSVSLVPLQDLTYIAWTAAGAKAIAAVLCLWYCRSYLDRTLWLALFRTLISGALMYAVLRNIGSENVWLNLSVGTAVYSLAIVILLRSTVFQLIRRIQRR